MTSLFDQLVGAWELVSYRLVAENGSATYPLGKDASGFIIYTPDGYMSAQLMRSGRKSYASGHPHAGTTNEMSDAAAGYIAYSGPFLVDEATRTLKHHMAVSLFPNWIGDTQVRISKLDGDSLRLSTDGPMTARGVAGTPTLEWRRAPGNR
jgi:hypothetical protein